MKVSHDFLMPDYYPAFRCKIGNCRSACCEGWPISFSIADYFKLLGVECSPDLRRKLDCAMHLNDHPTPESYAQILPRYDGQCPMRLEDGRCGIQAELGEDALAAVCRLYPRSVHHDGGYECSCANSCEAVLELFLNKEEPITFERRRMSFDLPDTAEALARHETVAQEQNIGLWLISIIQNRAYPLAQRFLLLGEAINKVEQALTAQDAQRIDDLISGKEPLSEPQEFRIEPDQLRSGLETMKSMLEILDKGSDSIRSFGESVLHYLAEDGAEKYQRSREHFQTLMPQWEIWFEHLLVNHIFFTRFPFQDPPMALHDKFLGLCAVYALLRFLCIGWTAEHGNIEAIVDAAAGAFRLIDHTDFDRYAVHVLKKIGCNDREHFHQILCL